MKKIICMIMAICLILSMASCAPQEEHEQSIPSTTHSETANPTEETMPSEATSAPTAVPTTEPTTEPTTTPTTEATTAPTTEPTTAPTTQPTAAPTEHQHAYTTTVVSPTCTDGGFTVDACACGANNVYNPVPALGHTFGEWVTTLEPTTTANGQQARACSVCAYQEFAPTEKLAACQTHNWVVTEKETVDPYPLRHYGYVTTACSVCGEKKGTEAKYFKPDNIDYATEASTIISMVNAMRASEGLSQLTTSAEWNDWAAVRAQDISVYYAHSRPNGASWGRNNGVDMAYGENIAKNANSGAEFYDGFLNSPQHCGLMKTPDATGIAVSICVNEYGDSYCAMVIYGPMGL